MPLVQDPVLDDPTFAWRAPLGVALLVALALRDRLRSGTWARARELAFLFGVTACAMAYALVHDAITWSISRDYFAIGKDLPDASRSFARVVPLALLAGWSAGLAVGLALVVANNPHPTRAQLRGRVLAREAALVLVAATSAAALGAVIGSRVGVSDASLLRDAGVADPSAFLVAQGAHLGSYLGAALATVAAVVRIRAARRRA